MSDETIIGRWARRKAEARVVRPVPETLALDAPTGEFIDPELTEQTSEAAIAALTGESDIGVFLRKGVASWAKNAALRRVWAMDPAIRDFVGEARDYGYDWNSGEGVPGFGPILASDNATSILDTMFSDVSLMDDKAPLFDATGEPAAPVEPSFPTSAADELAEHRDRESAPEERHEIAPLEAVSDFPIQDGAAREPQLSMQPEVNTAPQPRRHGSATPVLGRQQLPPAASSNIDADAVLNHSKQTRDPCESYE